MKKKPKKKLKSIGFLKKKADKALQDHYRRVVKCCELCGKSFQVAHHFIHKSQSNYLRYDKENFIFLCNSCHSKFHSFPEPTMAIRVLQIRSKKWYDYIQRNRHKIKRDNRKELEELLSSLS